MTQAEKVFRQHDVAPDAMTSTLYLRLNQDWTHLNVSASTAASVRRWGRTEPALAGFQRPGDVVDAIDAADQAGKDAVLLALLRLMQADDQHASRTLLQAMLPGLSNTARRIAGKRRLDVGDDSEDVRQAVVGEFWGVAAEYPVARRTSRVAANLALDTLKAVTKEVSRPVPIPFDPTSLFADVNPEGDFEIYRRINDEAQHEALATVMDGSDPEWDLLTTIAWGVEQHAISRAEAQTLAAVYLPAKTTGWGFDEVAATLGKSRAAIKMRCSRAAAKLATAVRLEIDGNTGIAIS